MAGLQRNPFGSLNRRYPVARFALSAWRGLSSGALRASLVSLGGALFLSAVLTAQTHLPVLSGRVVDQTGSALPGVVVQAASIDRKSRTTEVTDRDGRYVFAVLPDGQYALTFSEMNFADVRRAGVTVSVHAPVQVNVTMQLALDAAVVVTAPNTFRNLADLDHPEEHLVGVADAARVRLPRSKSRPARSCAPVRCWRPSPA